MPRSVSIIILSCSDLQALPAPHHPPLSIQLLQRPHSTRKILGRLWRGGGCEDSLAATAGTVTSTGFGSQPSKKLLSHPPGDTKGHQEHLLHPKIAPRVSVRAQMDTEGHILKPHSMEPRALCCHHPEIPRTPSHEAGNEIRAIFGFTFDFWSHQLAQHEVTQRMLGSGH